MSPRPLDPIDNLPEEALLLPWYVNGTLDAEDRRRVEAALAASAELREELALLRSVKDAVVASSDAVPESDPDGFAHLMARIEAEPQRTPAARPSPSARAGLARRLGAWLESAWRPAMAAAAVVIAVQAAAIFALMDGRTGGGEFSTASGPATATQARFLVGFADGAPLAAIRDLLEQADAVIVRGPTADGYFIVAAEGDADATAAALRAAADLVTQAERMP